MDLFISNLNEICKRDDLIARYERVLNSTEHERYTAMKSELRKIQFLVGRAMIFDYFGCSATVEANGALTVPHQYLSLSHSGHFVLLAVSDQPIGVDIENTAKSRDLQKWGDCYGIKFLNMDSFYQWFTRREAVYKSQLTNPVIRHYRLGEFMVCIAMNDLKESVRFFKTVPFYHQMQPAVLSFVGASQCGGDVDASQPDADHRPQGLY